MTNFNLKKMIYGALFAAIIFVSTYSIKIPVPATSGYIHPGDGFVLLAGLLLGPLYGTLAAGIGSALSDLIGGYSLWILPTFIIKGLMGAIVGYCSHRWIPNLATTALKIKLFISYLIAGILMVAGYYLAYGVIVGDFTTPLLSVPANLFQLLIGLIIATVLTPLVFNLKKSIVPKP